jgi:hypothetical protein
LKIESAEGVITMATGLARRATRGNGCLSRDYRRLSRGRRSFCGVTFFVAVAEPCAGLVMANNPFVALSSE